MIPEKHRDEAHEGYEGVLVDADCLRCAALLGRLQCMSKDEVGRLWDLAYRTKILDPTNFEGIELSEADAYLVESVALTQLTLERFGWPLGRIPEITQPMRAQIAGRTE